MKPAPPSPKQIWRARLRQELDQHPLAERHHDSTRLRQLLAQSTPWQSARSLLLYTPRPDEPDLTPLALTALADGKQIALPRYRPADDTYETALISHWSRDLLPGHYGLLEPSPACPIIPLNQLDLLLIPAVAFDVLGRRLGRGKGYYDRLLDHTHAVRCGVAFDWQVVQQLPAEPHDAPMNYLATPTRWLAFQSPPDPRP